MVNKKNELIFFKDFQTLILVKKKWGIKKRRKKEEGRAQFVFNCDIIILEPNNSTYLNISFILILCFDRETSDMILIIKNNISSYN